MKLADVVVDAGKQPQSVRKTNRRLEQALVKDILEFLALHPSVMFAWRAGAGALPIPHEQGRAFMRVNFPGCSDVLGIMCDGRMLAIEAKVGRNKATANQCWWLLVVKQAGGVSGVAYSIEDVITIIDGG